MARAIQFLRTKAKEWNFNPARIAVIGGSAGAASSLWLAYHDDMADPKAMTCASSVLKSLRAVAMGGQTTRSISSRKDWSSVHSAWNDGKQ